MGGCYAVKQAYVQGGLLMSAVDVSEYRRDQLADKKILEKLKLLDEILLFAESQKVYSDGSYREIIFPENGKVSFLAVAAPYNSIKPVSYWFPFVGRVPYKGFFSKVDRDDFIDELADQGLDTYKTEAGAFSLLGYFDDPIFPSMLLRSRPSMAHLFFHELTHKTVWIQNRPKFNERLAEFVAEFLTNAYLKKYQYEDDLVKYGYRKSDRELFNRWFSDLKSALVALYAENLSKEITLDRKSKTISHYMSLRPNFKAYDYVGKTKWNNARIAITNTYGTDYSDFKKSFECYLHSYTEPRLIGDFLVAVETRAEDHEGDKNLLDSFCQKSGRLDIN